MYCRLAINNDARTAQMVAQEVEDAVVRGVPAAPERDRSVRPGVVRGRRTRLPFVNPADVDGRHAVDRAHDAAAVHGVDEARAGAPARNGREPVLNVERHGVGDAGDGARRLVAVGIVGVRVTVGRGHRVGLGRAVDVRAADGQYAAIGSDQRRTVVGSAQS